MIWLLSEVLALPWKSMKSSCKYSTPLKIRPRIFQNVCLLLVTFPGADKWQNSKVQSSKYRNVESLDVFCVSEALSSVFTRKLNHSDCTYMTISGAVSPQWPCFRLKDCCSFTVSLYYALLQHCSCTDLPITILVSDTALASSCFWKIVEGPGELWEKSNFKKGVRTHLSKLL